MLYWIWHRRQSATRLPRAERRALNRLSRPARSIVDPVVSKLRRLPLHERVKVVDALDPWQRDLLEDRL